MALPHLRDHARIALVGDQTSIQQELTRHGLSPNAFDVCHAPEVIGMDESPTTAVKTKPKASLNVGMQQLQKSQLDVFISAGSTGAFLTSAVLNLGLLEGIKRPAAGALYPTSEGISLLIDVGVNTELKPDSYVDFARMGTVYMNSLFQLDNPSVALMNMGEEKSKGPKVVQEAYEALEAAQGLNFIGNAEGRDLPRGKADIYVCDGFTGNILLKFGEAFYELLRQRLSLDEQLTDFSYEEIGGLPFLGVNGNIILGHGISGPKAFKNMILRGQELMEHNLLENMRHAFQETEHS